MSNLTQNNAELLKFDGKPSWGAAFPQAMQHVLAMLIGNITPPMLIAGTCGLSAEEKIMLTQAAMIIGGITTLLQLFPVFGFGMKMPNVMGVAFAYMPILTIIGQQYGIAAIFGSQLVAGFVSIFVGMFIGKIRKFFPPIVSGTVVMSIGLSLYKTAISYIGGGSAAQANGTFGSGKFWFLAILTLIVTLACNFFGKGLVKASGMLIGIVVGYAASLLVGGVVSFADFEAASWFALPRPFYFGMEFHLDAIVMMILMYMVQAVQTIGDVSSTAIGGFGRQCTDQELGGAIKGQGICGMIGAVIGGLPTDPYHQGGGPAGLYHGGRHHAAGRHLPQVQRPDGYHPPAGAGRRHGHRLCGHHHVRHPAAERAAPELPQPDDRGHRPGHRPGHRRGPRHPPVCAPAAAQHLRQQPGGLLPHRLCPEPHHPQRRHP